MAQKLSTEDRIALKEARFLISRVRQKSKLEKGLKPDRDAKVLLDQARSIRVVQETNPR
jgi:hypothetical protein